MKPEDVLADDVSYSVVNGVRVRKGSIAAFLSNARTLLDPAATEEARRVAEVDLVALVPAVRAFGLLDICEVRDPRLRALIERVGPAIR